jgi:hypothetical protein
VAALLVAPGERDRALAPLPRRRDVADVAEDAGE